MMHKESVRIVDGLYVCITLFSATQPAHRARQHDQWQRELDSKVPYHQASLDSTTKYEYADSDDLNSFHVFSCYNFIWGALFTKDINTRSSVLHAIIGLYIQVRE